MDPSAFSGLVKDILNNFYDFAALEAHPLVFTVIKPPPGHTGSRVEYVRGVMLAAINDLKPPSDKVSPASAEWRPYLLLYKRYVEGMGLKELSSLLTIGDRQLRREHHRALRALNHVLWNRLFPDEPLTGGEDLEALPEDETPAAGLAPLPENLTAAAELPDDGSSDATSGVEAFQIIKEQVDLNETVQAVLQITGHRARAEGLAIQSELSAGGLSVEADRVILRQILISLINEAISLQAGGRDEAGGHGETSGRDEAGGHDETGEAIAIKTAAVDGGGEVEVRFAVGPSVSAERLAEGLQTARYWCEPIGAVLDIHLVGDLVRLTLRLAAYPDRPILVVDDQLPVINLFRRLLTPTHLTVIGVTQAEEIFSLVQQHRPALIILDVMMPQVDGWEILQRLKVDEATRAIPVVICSAWAAPDLAFSLGATAFLKKPVTQKAVLDLLEQLGIK